MTNNNDWPFLVIKQAQKIDVFNVDYKNFFFYFAGYRIDLFFHIFTL